MSASGIESSGIATKVTLYPYEITPGSRLKKVVSTQWALYLGKFCLSDYCVPG